MLCSGSNNFVKKNVLSLDTSKSWLCITNFDFLAPPKTVSQQIAYVRPFLFKLDEVVAVTESWQIHNSHMHSMLSNWQKYLAICGKGNCLCFCLEWLHMLCPGHQSCSSTVALPELFSSSVCTRVTLCYHFVLNLSSLQNLLAINMVIAIHKQSFLTFWVFFCLSISLFFSSLD